MLPRFQSIVDGILIVFEIDFVLAAAHFRLLVFSILHISCNFRRYLLVVVTSVLTTESAHWLCSGSETFFRARALERAGTVNEAQR